ncbi:MAG: CHRD domain-containing protein [Leptolyngbya sp. SIO4C5]|nr:CHRD domain-containing protein [Leptolyngbya sp. SIO4C5]
MSSMKKIRFLLLGGLTCLCLVVSGWLSPVLGRTVAAVPSTVSPVMQANMSDGFWGQAINSNLQQARSVLMAQGATDNSLMSYVAVMSEENVVPNSPDTLARGAVGAVLSGDRLVVRGSFNYLSSPMRNYATDPVSPPNPNITSAFHIHQGSPSENGPFQYALDVTLDTEMSGSAMGEYTLTPEQLQALSSNRLYVDIHTTQNRGGELRAILMPY